ncbi:MAG: DUF1810 domain-containing protein [Gammaproteobacteria bacterium]|nr:DUF1810 domain-containing protein [Gammaproteobacteria bacterium]MDH3364249.1 DUF1810 domain-containing protein [Gammaproteobacteria bacterium]
MSDPYKLSRFVAAQEGGYAAVVEELRRGRKTGHWIWYIFPQIKGLGHSGMSRRYSISSIEEARAYSEHPLLGPRLVECLEAVMAVEGRTASEIFGHPDYLKFRSCLTLFAATRTNGIYQQALDRYFDGVPDALTVEALHRS